ncbi:MAG: hypothetical protein ACREI3_02615, partial [Nitrospirales bacterium]
GMAWARGKRTSSKERARKQKRTAPPTHWGLDVGVKQKQPVSIDELRRQGLLLAVRGIGQYSRPVTTSPKQKAKGKVAVKDVEPTAVSPIKSAPAARRRVESDKSLVIKR